MSFAGKRIAIFGCGYLGERVARRALEVGMEVTALTRNAGQAEGLSRLGIQFVVNAELDRPEWRPRVDARQDFVLNCVGSAGGGWWGYRKSYLDGMRSLLEWASNGAIGTLVFTSSTSVYAQDHGGWVTEADPAEGASEGGKILRQAEALLENAPPSVARAFVLRLGGIYGPGRHRLLDRARREEEAENEKENERDDVFLNAIRVEDAAAAVWAAFGVDRTIGGGVFNIVDDLPARKREVVRYLRERLRERRLLGSEAPPSKRRGGARPSRKISNRKAREILGWRPEYPDYRAGYEPLLEALE